MLGFSSPLRAEAKTPSSERTENGFSNPLRPSRPTRERRRRPTRFAFETLEPRIALSDVSGAAEVASMSNDDSEPLPDPDGNPPDDLTPIPDGPVLPA